MSKPAMKIFYAKKLPQYANDHAAGLDLHMANEEKITLQSQQHALIYTGVHVAIPHGYFGLVAIRSGLGMKGVVLSNGIGVIDEDYRGEIRIPLYYHGEGELSLEPGERIAQMVLIPYTQAQLMPVDSVEALGQTDRGTAGFGSSGRF